jgi:hypothetical protein
MNFPKFQIFTVLKQMPERIYGAANNKITMIPLDDVRYVWEERNCGSCEELGEMHDRLAANLASKTEIANQLKDGLADAFERETNLKAERDALAAQVARLENELRQQKLIHVGFTNETQVQFVTEHKQDGQFCPSSDDGCYIPLYMLNIHAHRVGPDSEIYKEHCELWKHKKHLAEIRAEAALAGYIRGGMDQSLAPEGPSVREMRADQYAEKIRQGGAE